MAMEGKECLEILDEMNVLPKKQHVYNSGKLIKRSDDEVVNVNEREGITNSKLRLS